MLSNLTLSFPNFNLYSTPLLVLVLQGLIFFVLLCGKYFKTKSISYAILAIILLITCYHRTTYTIGFMDWYDTYRNTKINYYLVNLSLILVPLIYFYVKSITTSNFKFQRKHLWHFFPGALYIIIKIVILIYDASQPEFAETQNGYLVQNFQWIYLDPFETLLSYVQQIIYLVLTISLFISYRRNIQQYFSNTYSLELNWIRNFLFIYTLLFVYDLVQTMVHLTITELNWMQKWWLQFFNALAIIYIGIKSYFTDTDKLKGLGFDDKTILELDKGKLLSTQKEGDFAEDVLLKKHQISSYFESKKPYLDPELNLILLAEQLNMKRAEVSEIINNGFGVNFNDFVNSYRVDAVKEMLSQGKQEHLSLLGIALECGFNSKATFNRVFKKITRQSPTGYLSSL